MKQTRPFLFALTLWIGALVLFTGCFGKLADNGAYRGDKLLYSADASIVASKQILDVFVSWERDNEAILKSFPQVHAFADDVRAKAPAWFRQAYVARDLYKSDPSQANQSALNTILRVIKGALTEALQYLTNYGPQTVPTPTTP